jgi:hypothetical protein
MRDCPISVTTRSRWGGTFWPALAVALITFVVFSPVLSHHFIESWDDSRSILANPDFNPPRLQTLLRHWTHQTGTYVFYVPVTYTLWGLLAAMSRGTAPPGLPFNPAFFYGANLLAHVGSVVIVYLILRQLVQRQEAAFFGAALFAVHPIQVEAIANAWTVYTPLSAMFSLLAIWQYLAFSREGGRWSHYAVATAAFMLALLTKPTVATVPLILGAIEIGLRGKRLRQIILPLGAWLVPIPLLFVLNHASAPASTIYRPDLIYLPLVPLDAIAFYLGKIIAPVGLVMDYGRTPKLIALDPTTISPTGAITLALLAACWFLRRRLPWLTVSFAVFVLALLPTLGLVPFDFQFYSTVADRYAYLAMLAPALLVALLLDLPRPQGFRRSILTGAMTVLLIACGVASVLQLRTWRDDWQLAAYTLKVRPQSKAGTFILRYLLTSWSHFDPPEHPFPAPSHCTLDASTLAQLGDLMDRNKYFDLAIKLDRMAIEREVPRSDLQTQLALACLHHQDLADAQAACAEALRLNPANQKAKKIAQNVAARMN